MTPAAAYIAAWDRWCDQGGPLPRRPRFRVGSFEVVMIPLERGRAGLEFRGEIEDTHVPALLAWVAAQFGLMPAATEDAPALRAIDA